MDEYEFESMRLDLSTLDAAYEKFGKEDDSMSGVPNAKLTKQWNADFRLKLEAWKTRASERKSTKKRAFEQGKAQRLAFVNAMALFSVGKEKIVKCQDDYNVFSDDKAHHAKVVKVINNFLCELPGGMHTTLEL